ncbi:methyltransferase [Hoeflea prorocentri]|uniref:Methyltransferase n=1 Tax=Hoeflea prorocentri TaxID=1922333 RepID=A0A9X3UGI6_9HYPH|nr:methyltransferase [Hoeflea prorocentri]MCY6380090.1 methyltransferase [Hoeflea prorocentri]MDA5397890.1 methyltransferase [Hoeflea prorocentri]
MHVEHNQKIALCEFGEELGLIAPETRNRQDKQKKVEQILSFVEEIATVSRHYSKSKPLQLVDGAAGSCALGFFIYHYYHGLIGRSVQVKSIDTNAALMQKAANTAHRLGFSGMDFQNGDVLDLETQVQPDVVCGLHACDLATDKVIALGVRTGARNILSVSCCQHSFRKKMTFAPELRFFTEHRIYRDRMTYMVADSMRALLLEMVGYRASVVEFVSSRATDKNAMLRAARTNLPASRSAIEGYLRLRDAYRTAPRLEDYLFAFGRLPEAVRT